MLPERPNHWQSASARSLISQPYRPAISNPHNLNHLETEFRVSPLFPSDYALPGGGDTPISIPFTFSRLYNAVLRLTFSLAESRSLTTVRTARLTEVQRIANLIDRKPLGATRFRRKLSRPEGMPGATCPQQGGKLETPTQTWLLLPNQKLA